MPFSAWSETDPAGADAASTIDDAIRRAHVRVRERIEQLFSDWSTATDRVHAEKLYIHQTNGFTERNHDDTSTLRKLSSVGIQDLPLQPRCRLRRSTFTISPSNTLVPIQWDTEDFDVGTMFDSGSNTRVTIGANGLYLIMYQGRVEANEQNGGEIEARLRKNGSTQEGGNLTLLTTVGTGERVDQHVSLNMLVNAVATDYFEVLIRVIYSTGSSVLDSMLSVVKVA